jgi:hypothetical protein
MVFLYPAKSHVKISKIKNQISNIKSKNQKEEEKPC